MIFIDTWAWVPWPVKMTSTTSWQRGEHNRLKAKRQRYVTTNFVLSEVISHLYRRQKPEQAAASSSGLLLAVDDGLHRFIDITATQFRRAWAMRQKYDDKPDISFVDFTRWLSGKILA